VLRIPAAAVSRCCGGRRATRALRRNTRDWLMNHARQLMAYHFDEAEDGQQQDGDRHHESGGGLAPEDEDQRGHRPDPQRCALQGVLAGHQNRLARDQERLPDGQRRLADAQSKFGIGMNGRFGTQSATEPPEVESRDGADDHALRSMVSSWRLQYPERPVLEGPGFVSWPMEDSTRRVVRPIVWARHHARAIPAGSGRSSAADVV
jgi:hypothetical protein